LSGSLAGNAEVRAVTLSEGRQEGYRFARGFGGCRGNP
jgi:hypothetical protein